MCKHRHANSNETNKQEKRVFQVDIDIRNAFNAMLQAAPWHVMNMFRIPDVDLLKQFHFSVPVYLAPNDAESATITCDTGVAQGSITSPQLFNIFMNGLLQMLTSIGQNQGYLGISHGLQISKDKGKSSQDTDNDYQLT